MKLTWNDVLGSNSSDQIKNYLEKEQLKRQEELIDEVGKLILDRLDHLLDKDTDELVRILIENKLFRDENTGLKKIIDGLEERISSLERQILLFEARNFNYGGDTWTTTHYPYGTCGWPSVISMPNTVFSGPDITAPTTTPPANDTKNNTAGDQPKAL